MLRILTLSTLFPDATRPNFGVFVERQTLGLAAHADVSLQAVAPIGLPPGPLRRLGHSATLATLPTHERWKGGEHVVNLPEGRTGWVIPITGSGSVADVAFKAGECVTVTGSESIETSADADVLFAYSGTTRI